MAFQMKRFVCFFVYFFLVKAGLHAMCFFVETWVRGAPLNLFLHRTLFQPYCEFCVEFDSGKKEPLHFCGTVRSQTHQRFSFSLHPNRENQRCKKSSPQW